MLSHYNVLGVNPWATPEEIKQAFQQLSIKHHPSHFPGDKKAELAFNQILDAYTVLSNPISRKNYDRTIFTKKHSSEGTLGYFIGAYEVVKKIASRKLALVFSSFGNLVTSFRKFVANREFIIVSLILLFVLWIGYKQSQKSGKKYHSPPAQSKVETPENGDLDKTFSKNEDPLPNSTNQISNTVSVNKPNRKKAESSEDITTRKKKEFIADGWNEDQLKNGLFPLCYNFQPQRGEIDNRLEVRVGSGTDVAIKVMNLERQICIRYVFINRNSSYSIRNIPEGRYYLKIAYGKDWFSKEIGGVCLGKFLRSPMYEQGDEIMDFNVQEDDDSYSIPSFRLSLDVVASNSMNTFSSQNISESEFNK